MSNKYCWAFVSIVYVKCVCVPLIEVSKSFYAMVSEDPPIKLPHSMICLIIRVYFRTSSYARRFNQLKKSITYRLIIIIINCAKLTYIIFFSTNFFPRKIIMLYGNRGVTSCIKCHMANVHVHVMSSVHVHVHETTSVPP